MGTPRKTGYGAQSDGKRERRGKRMKEEREQRKEDRK